MKKLIAIMLSLAVALSLAACAVNKEPESPTAAPSAAPTEVPSEAPAPTIAPTEIVLKTIEDYIAYAKAQLDAEKESVDSSEVLTMKYYAEGNALVYEYQYTSVATANATALKESLDAMRGNYVLKYNELSSLMGRDDVSIILRYLMNDGRNLLDYVVDKEYASVTSAPIEEPTSAASPAA